MTIGFALDYIPRMLQEQGVKNYITYYRHLRVTADSSISIKGTEHHYLLIDPVEEITVESRKGIFDVNLTTLNELQYHHTGEIIISNTHAIRDQLVRFIQVVPKKTCVKKKN